MSVHILVSGYGGSIIDLYNNGGFMWLKIKNFILAHLVQSVVLGLIVVGGIAGTSYFVSQEGNSLINSDNKNESTSGSSTKSCNELVKIGTMAVEKDPAGDPGAWLRFDYKTSGNQALNCQYTITFYDSKEEVIRTIPNVEDTFQSPSGQIYNGYSITPYQAGMTARVTVQKNL